jgi:hypothetical protein
MADNSPKFTACVTTGSKLSNLEVKNGQLILIKDTQEVAFDFNDKRVYYKDIITLHTEQERLSLLAPVANKFYFVEETFVLWRRNATSWMQITKPPQDIMFIGDSLPETGTSDKLYINTAHKEISIWNGETYDVVSNKSESISDEELKNIFKI